MKQFRFYWCKNPKHNDWHVYLAGDDGTVCGRKVPKNGVSHRSTSLLAYERKCKTCAHVLEVVRLACEGKVSMEFGAPERWRPTNDG